MFQTIKDHASIIRQYPTFIKEELASRKEIRTRQTESAEYNAMIAASQAKLAETTLVPGYTKIYA
jgi:hypothetical protein